MKPFTGFSFHPGIIDANFRVFSASACTHTLDTHKDNLINTRSQRGAIKGSCLQQEWHISTGGGVFLLIFCLRPFNLHPDENNREAYRCSVTAAGEKPRQPIFNGCRLSAREELGEHMKRCLMDKSSGEKSAGWNPRDKGDWKHFISSFAWKSFIWENWILFWMVKKEKHKSGTQSLWFCQLNICDSVFLRSPQRISDTVSVIYIKHNGKLPFSCTALKVGIT